VVGLLGPDVDGAAIRRWNLALRHDGRNRVAVPLVVPDGVSAPDVLEALRVLDLCALVVAPELQEIVGQALDEIEPGACRQGRVSLIEWRDGRLAGCWEAREQDVSARLDRLAVAS
jgi:hypothetical protein